MKAGNGCRAEVRVVAITVATLARESESMGASCARTNPVMEVQLTFFFHGRFTSYENTFLKRLVSVITLLSLSLILMLAF